MGRVSARATVHRWLLHCKHHLLSPPSDRIPRVYLTTIFALRDAWSLKNDIAGKNHSSFPYEPRVWFERRRTGKYKAAPPHDAHLDLAASS